MPKYRPISLFLMVFLLLPILARAESSILVYPKGNAVFQFDPSSYKLIYPGDSLYDPAYDRFGVMLWDINRDRIAYELYQAPGLLGFEPGYMQKNAFNLPTNRLTLYVDGFYRVPRRLSDIYVRFLPTPSNAEPVIYVNDSKVEGLVYYIPELVVSTPTENGFFSDRISLDIVWSGAQAMEIMVFSDKNGDGVFEGTQEYSVFMQDQTIATEETSWGEIKARYH